jgi:hypothetical protein
LVEALQQAAKSSSPKAKIPTAAELLFVDDSNTSVWLKLPTKELRTFAGKPLKVLTEGKEPLRMQQLRTPFDRNGILHKKTYLQTCDELDAALSNYRSECTADCVLTMVC